MLITRAPIRDQVYRHILEQVDRGDLPAGSRVRDTALAVVLGVSRTPVREALLRLAGDGVLDAEAGRGFRVRRLDRAEIGEVGAMLGALEPLALELSSEILPERLARLEAVAERLERTRGDALRCIDLDDEWHRILLEGCPNQRLLRLIATLRQIPRRYLHAYLREAGRVSLSTIHHSRVLQALRRGERATAAELLRRRWQRGVKEMESWIP
ncbi:MAG: GntR family transcriptional regulator [Gemmatimonadales bacterium]|nr:GntR family transcriptional regulator [Gemmatimonadales bacterium]